MTLRMLVALAILGATMAVYAAAPPAPWTEAQKAKLAERQRLEKSLDGLLDQKKYDELLASMKSIAELDREVLGETDAMVGSYQRLASWQEALGRFAESVEVRRDVLRLQEKRLGKAHWEATDARIAFTDAERLGKMTAEQRGKLRQTNDWNQQVARLSGQGKAKEALALAVKVREIREEILGKKHPQYAASLNNLAILYQSMGEPKEAVSYATRALDVLGGHLDDSFDMLGERQRNQTLQQVLHNLGILLSLQEQAGVPEAQRYSRVLAWKGRVAAHSALDRLASDRPELKETLDKLQSARARLTRLTLQTPTPAQQVGWLKEVQTLNEQKEALEADLAKRSAEFRDRKQLVALAPEQLAKQLPEGVAFVDLLEYSHTLRRVPRPQATARAGPRATGEATARGRRLRRSPRIRLFLRTQGRSVEERQDTPRDAAVGLRDALRQGDDPRPIGRVCPGVRSRGQVASSDREAQQRENTQADRRRRLFVA